MRDQLAEWRFVSGPIRARFAICDCPCLIGRLRFYFDAGSNCATCQTCGKTYAATIEDGLCHLQEIPGDRSISVA